MESRAPNIEVLYERAKIHARAAGYPDDADDFAGWISSKWLEGKSQHQKIEYSLIDYLREQLGSARKYGSTDALLRRNRAPEPKITEAREYSVEESLERTINERGIGEGDTQESALLEQQLGLSRYGTYGHPIKGGVRFLYEEGLTMGQIGEIYGITESRISQIIKEARREIERDYGLERMREKIECDETELEIKWLII